MKKLIAWFLNTTKVGSVVGKVQQAVDGKKQMIASLIAALTATATILAKFGAAQGGGLDYLVTLPQTPEFLAASAGWIGFFNALKGEKIRAENAEILEKLDAVAPAETPKP